MGDGEERGGPELLGIAILILICWDFTSDFFSFHFQSELQTTFHMRSAPFPDFPAELTLLFLSIKVGFLLLFHCAQLRRCSYWKHPFLSTLVNKIFSQADKGISEARLFVPELAFLNCKTLHHMFSSHVLWAGEFNL